MPFRRGQIVNHQRKLEGVEYFVIAVPGEWTFLATKQCSVKGRSQVDTEHRTGSLLAPRASHAMGIFCFSLNIKCIGHGVLADENWLCGVLFVVMYP